jgi:hypothetical protein
MRPFTLELIVARNATVAVAPMAMFPPALLVAPVPSRTRTVRDAPRYSPWSSLAASVLVPLFAPAVMRIDPGKKVRPLGTTSFSTTLVAASLPVLVALIVYSMMSPGRTAPPGWTVRSVTVFVAPLKSGLYVEMDVTNAPSR